MAPSAPLIKGYLPIRLKLPPTDDQSEDETFFYVKEHHTGPAKERKNGNTLFVVNAPVVPGVQTRILLKSIFGRYGEITRVTVVPNPRQQNQKHHQTTTPDASSSLLLSWTAKFHAPSFLPPIHSEGKFAHVVFASNKEMKRALRSLTEIMSSSSQTMPGLTLDKIEIQTLADESERQYRKENNDSNDNDSDDGMESPKKQKGILAVAERYRASCRRLSREALMEECNAVMQEFEDAEEQDRLAREAAANEPDKDGFVTVTYSAQVGSKRELEDSGGDGGRRRKGQKRSRKKKETIGKQELKDFYRFQTKEKRKKSLEELRQRFEEDLAKVKKMKEERKYRPF